MYTKRRGTAVGHSNRIYDIVVLLEYDEAKSARNERERGIGFSRFQQLHMAVVTFREPFVRVISLRRANMREERTYAKTRESA